MSANALTASCAVSIPLAALPECASEPPRENAEPVFAVKPPGWYGWGKPVLDFALALALTIPALVLVTLAALAVRLTSSGPAFYAQTRVGKNGRRFTLLKLRTMRHRCEDGTGPQWSPNNDDRVTRVGRFLRRTHLDELPQLWNVLRGDMSLVGPRPERPEIIAALALDRVVPGYSERLAVRPGLTGLAQLLLPPDVDVESVRRKVACDREYIANRTLWLDVRLLLDTLLRTAGVGLYRVRQTLALPDSTAHTATAPKSEPTSDPPSAFGSEEWRTTVDELCAVREGAPQRPPVEGERAAVRMWFRKTVVPVLHDLASELRQHGRRVKVSVGWGEEVWLRVWDRRGRREMDLKFRARRIAGALQVCARELVRDGRRDFVHEHPLGAPGAAPDRAQVIAFVLARFRATARVASGQ